MIILCKVVINNNKFYNQSNLTLLFMNKYDRKVHSTGLDMSAASIHNWMIQFKSVDRLTCVLSGELIRCLVYRSGYPAGSG